MYGHIPVVARVVNKHAILDEGVGSSSVHVDGIDNTVTNQQLGKLVQIGSGGRHCLAKNRNPSVSWYISSHFYYTWQVLVLLAQASFPGHKTCIL